MTQQPQRLKVSEFCQLDYESLICIPQSKTEERVYIALLTERSRPWLGAQVLSPSGNVRGKTSFLTIKEQFFGIFNCELSIVLRSNLLTLPTVPLGLFKFQMCIAEGADGSIDCYWKADAQELSRMWQCDSIDYGPSLSISDNHQVLDNETTIPKESNQIKPGAFDFLYPDS